MKRVSYFKLGAICGSLLTAVLTSTRQDIIGREAYIEMTRDHWLEPRFSWPLNGLMVLAIALIVAYAGYWAEAEDHSESSDGPG